MPAPQRLGAYDLQVGLGRGAMGAVWAAVRRADGLPVAVKVVTGSVAAAVIEREVRAMARLDHPHVVALQDLGRVVPGDTAPYAPGTPWYAMERAEADLRARPPGDADELLDVLRQVLAGLAHAHAHGLVHCDLKPENVLWVKGLAKLADFGIAARSGRARDRRCGTPAYIAPETVEGRPPGPWTDLYALGCMAWRFLAGRSPFERTSLTETLQAHRTEPLPPDPPPGAPEGFHAWVLGLTQKDPRHRTRSAADALQGLERLGAAGADALPVPDRGAMTTFLAFEAMDPLPPPSLAADAVPAHAPVPSVPPWRRPARQALPVPRHGASVATLGLRHPPVVGRDAAIDALWGALEEAVRTGRPVLRWLDGPPGAGRWALAERVRTLAIELGVAHGVALDHDPAAGLRDALGEDARTAAEAWGHPAPLGVLGDLPHVQEPSDVVWMVGEAARAADRPVVVAVRAGDALGCALRDALHGAPALVLAVGRGEDAQTLALGPLDDADVRLALRNVLPLDDDAMRELVRRADGWPGLAVDLARRALESGALAALSDGRLTRVRGRALPLPGDGAALDRSLDATLAALPTDALAALERRVQADGSDAAGLPGLAVPETARAVLGDPRAAARLRDRLEDTAWGRVRAEEAVARGASGPRVLLRAGRLEEAARTALASKDPADVAVASAALDLLGASDAHPLRYEEASRTFDVLYAQGALRPATWWLGRLAACAGADVQRQAHVAAMAVQASVAMDADPLPAARRLAELSSLPRHRLLVAKAFRSTGRAREGLAALELPDAPERAPTALGVALAGMRANLLVVLGREAEALELVEHGVSASAELPEVTRVFRWLDRAGVRLECGDPDGALEDLQRCEASFARMGNAHGQRNVTYLQAKVDLASGALDLAWDRYERCLELTMALGAATDDVAPLALAVLARRGAWARVDRLASDVLGRQGAWVADPDVAHARWLAGIARRAADVADRRALLDERLATSGMSAGLLARRYPSPGP